MFIDCFLLHNCNCFMKICKISTISREERGRERSSKLIYIGNLFNIYDMYIYLLFVL